MSLVGVDENQEAIARLFIIRNTISLALPVVDLDKGQLAGIITVDDIIDVISEEATGGHVTSGWVKPGRNG